MRRIYLDYAASTPVDPEVERAMRPYFTKKFGNPGSLHSFGQEAIAAVDLSRERIAKAIGADFREIIFTGSATEANNLALRGCVSSVKRHASGIENPRIVVSAIEHESVLETARDLEKEGVEVVYLPADREGFVDIKKLESSLNERTILVSVMYANNEIGTVQPVAEISRIIHDFRKEIRFASTRFTRPATRSLVLADLPLGGKGKRADHAKSAAGVLDKANFFLSWPLFHTDAAQAFQFLDCNVDELGVDPVRGRSPQGGRSRAFSGAASNGVDLMTLSGHKIYGPKGVGVLYVKSKFQNPNIKQNPNSKIQMIKPIVTGGGQEFGLRSGTENVPLVVGFARAVELATKARAKEKDRILKLRDYFWEKLNAIVPEAERNGGEPALPNIVNVYFPRHRAEDMLVKLDLAGIAASSGSACRARSITPSHVILAMGYSEERAKRSVRFSFGRPTTRQDIDTTLTVIKNSFTK